MCPVDVFEKFEDGLDYVEKCIESFVGHVLGEGEGGDFVLAILDQLNSMIIRDHPILLPMNNQYW